MRVFGVILAGGASRRFGSDKRHAMLGGQTLLKWAVERAYPQVETLVLNTNDPPKPDLPTNLECVADAATGDGPLAGILAGLAETERRGFTHLASFACDTPFFPHNTVARLASSLQSSTEDYAVASCGAAAHRIFALWPVACRARLAHAFTNGVRSMRDIENWLEPTWADFPNNGSPDGDPFFNINTPSDLEIAERWLLNNNRIGRDGQT